MPKFELDRLDYEPPGKSASVVNTPKGSRKAKALQRPLDTKSEPGTERKKNLVRLETPKGSARRKARKGEYEGSVRSLRTQQRAKNQRQ
ncbi:hypothetical protein ACIQMR_04195, partial [Streptomyces sp. NPDC091376]|uniref:hypothetical protein n=1 Tax=Streptomyces sp. NPDC091376 TaxID=3365994 RepID=UPI00382B7F55